jgi:hypothetical protein
METTTNPQTEKLPAMLPASTEISREASAKVDALAEKDDRTRAYVLRQMIHAACDKLPTPRRKMS